MVLQDIHWQVLPIPLPLQTRAKYSDRYGIGRLFHRHGYQGEQVPYFIWSCRIFTGRFFQYLYHYRQELSIPTDMGLVGYSIGMGIRVNRFHISYGLAGYSLAGSSNTFTITDKS